MRSHCQSLVLAIASMLIILPGRGADDQLTRDASTSLRRAVEFFHGKVAAHGGYVYRYSADLNKREGEGKTGTDTVWVQPPGTPAVGMAYLEAYELTREPYLLEAARAAGECLIRGQLRSGGWTNNIEFGPADRARFAYRVDTVVSRRAFNWTTFDDDKTQSAMRFLMRLDCALDFKDQKVHEAIAFALEAVVKAQHPNGGWPQGFQEPADRSRPSMKAASYPQSWPRIHPGGDYWVFYTFNDNTIADTIEMLLLAASIYREPRYRESALRAGDFIRLAQMPEPQPAWAQQYDFEMHPVWARRFEPPAVSGGESQGVIQVLLRLYEETGDRQYLAPVPRALAYLQRSLLPNGRLARFYELTTNRPLYFTKKYELTYDDSDVPTHYSFQVASRLGQLSRLHDQLSSLSPQQLSERRAERSSRRASTPSDTEVRAVIEGLDDRGAWVEDGRLSYHGNDDDTRRIIASATFIRNAGILSRYVAASKKQD